MAETAYLPLPWRFQLYFYPIFYPIVMASRLLRFLFIFLVFSLQARAQAYEPGLLVRSNGDTLRGEIENGFWVEPPTFIRFRPTPQAASVLFQPRQLRAVRLGKARYFRYEALPLDHAAETRLDLLPGSNVANVKIDSVLAEVLVESTATLLRVVLPGATHYVVRRPGRAVLDLSERRYLSNGPTGARTVANGNNYRGQLTIYFGDCPAANTAAQKAAFTTAGLAAVVQAYNTTCGAPGPASRTYLASATPRSRVALRGGVLAGVRYNRLESHYGPTHCVDCRPHPFAGLYGELLLPGRAAALYGELSTSTFRNEGLQLASYTYVPFAYRAWLHTARLGLRFFFNLPHEQQLLLGLGYELNVVASRSGIPAGSSPNVLIRQADEYGEPTLFPNLSLGWRRQRLTLSLDGQLYGTQTDDGGAVFFGTDYALRLGMGYRLGRNPDATTPRPAPAP